MIDAPWYRDPIETTAFNLYAMDEEGLFSTREEKIQKVIDYLISSPDPNDELIQEQAFISAKLDINSFFSWVKSNCKMAFIYKFNNYFRN